MIWSRRRLSRLLTWLAWKLWWVTIPTYFVSDHESGLWSRTQNPFLASWMLKQAQRLDPHWQHWAADHYVCPGRHTECEHCGGTSCTITISG